MIQLSIRPCAGGSKTVQLQYKDNALDSLHRPRVGGWATFADKSRLHRRRVGAGQKAERKLAVVAHQSAVHRRGVGGAVKHEKRKSKWHLVQLVEFFIGR